MVVPSNNLYAGSKDPKVIASVEASKKLSDDFKKGRELEKQRKEERKKLKKIYKDLSVGESITTGKQTFTGGGTVTEDVTYTKTKTGLSIDGQKVFNSSNVAAPRVDQRQNIVQGIYEKKQTEQIQQNQQKYESKPVSVYTSAPKLNPVTETIRTRGQSESTFGAKEFGLGAVSVVQQFGKDLINPVGAIKRNVIGVKTLITQPVQSVTSFAMKTTTPRGSGELAGIIGLTKGTGFGLQKISKISPKAATFTSAYLNPETTFIDKVFTKIKDTGLKIGAKYVPQEQVFSSDVLVKGQTFPTSKSVPESLTRFRSAKGQTFISETRVSPTETILDLKTNLVGSSATSTKFAKQTFVSAGEKATVQNLEDAGLYITPKGQGSPYFTRVGSDPTEYSAGLFPSLEAFKKPSVINVEYSKISTYPKNILKSEGFEDVNKFLSTQGKAGKETAYITKRFTLGQTSEIEAVIPQNTPISLKGGGNIINKLTGFKEYTTYKGRTIPIFEYKINKGLSESIDFPKTTISSELSSGKGYYSYQKQSKIFPKYNILSKTQPKDSYLVSSKKTSSKSYDNYVLKGSSILPSSKKGSSYSPTSYKTSYSKSIKYDPISYKPSSKKASSYEQIYKTGSSSTYKDSYTPPYKPYRSIKPTKYVPKPRPPPPDIRNPPRIRLNLNYSKSFSGLNTFAGFGVKVKRRGKYEVLGTGLTQAEAIRFGQIKTDTSTARTFKIFRTGAVKRSKAGVVDLFRYKRSKKDPFAFIEKSRFAISTSGEKGELKKGKRNKNLFRF